MTLINSAKEIYRHKGILGLSLAFMRYSLFMFNKTLVNKKSRFKEVQSNQLSRNDKLRKFCNISSGVGLEIGPLSIPIVRKDEGIIYYVDRFSTEQLKEKYKSAKWLEIGNIVPVDFIIEEISYEDIQSEVKTIDYIIASHILEHCPNPLGWLRCLAKIIQPKGIISLAIPDRRYTFDYYRRETTLAQLLAYDLEGLTKPSIEQVLDCFMNICKVDTKAAWILDYSALKPEKQHEFHSADDIIKLIEREGNDAYTHCTVWTFESFCEIFPQAMKIANIPLEISCSYEPEKFSNEFIVQLKLCQPVNSQ
jgi:predicted SAM-dependent methyltransferase